MGNGFFALTIAVSLISLAEMRGEPRRLPQLAAAIGGAAGFLSAIGWSLGEQMGIAIGGPNWLISTLLMCFWLVWFGFAGRLAANETRSVAA